MKQETATVYCIKDPDTQKIVYIGKSEDFTKRQHTYKSSLKKKRPKRESIKTWVWDTLTAGKMPVFEILEIVSACQAAEAKKKWIKHLSKHFTKPIFQNEKVRPNIQYTTYCIRDPLTGLVVYVGQTRDFEKRKRSHLRIRQNERPRIKTQNIKTYMWDTLSKNLVPSFEILETVQTIEESLKSETKWVLNFSEKNHVLLNRWKEHRNILKR